MLWECDVSRKDKGGSPWGFPHCRRTAHPCHHPGWSWHPQQHHGCCPQSSPRGSLPQPHSLQGLCRVTSLPHSPKLGCGVIKKQIRNVSDLYKNPALSPTCNHILGWAGLVFLLISYPCMKTGSRCSDALIKTQTALETFVAVVIEMSFFISLLITTPSF